MKRIFLCVFAIIMLMCFSYTVSAGSVPEDLLYDDNAQIFFAEIIEYKEDTENSYANSYIKVIPVKKVKGDIEIGDTLTYKSPCIVGGFKIKANKAYLLAYFDENNPIYVLRASDYDVKSIDLIDVDEDNGMWSRFETYIKNGEYTKAETERLKNSGEDNQELQIKGELPPLHLDEKYKTYTFIYCFSGVIIIALLILIIYKYKVRKGNN